MRVEQGEGGDEEGREDEAPGEPGQVKDEQIEEIVEDPSGDPAGQGPDLRHEEAMEPAVPDESDDEDLAAGDDRENATNRIGRVRTREPSALEGLEED